MKKRSDPGATLQEKLIGLGERSFRKSRYPELQQRLDHLERFRALLDHSRDIILLAVLPSARIVDANVSASLQLGYERSQLEQSGIEEILDFDHLHWPEEGCLEGLLVSSMVRRDGTLMPVEFSLCVDTFGASSYLVVVARDISERLRQGELLRQSEERFRSVFHSAGLSMAVIRPTGEIVQVNPAMCRFLGYREEELCRMSVVDVTHPEDRERTKTFYDEVLSGKRDEIRYEKRYLRKDGRIVWGDAIVTWLYDPDHRPLYCVAQVQDTTERKRAEAILRESDRIKTEFISTAAHEFRTPLTSIQGFAELLLRGSVPPEKHSTYLNHIFQKSLALGRIIDELLDLARIEAGQGISLRIGPWAVGDLLAQAEPLIEADQKGHLFTAEIEAGETVVSADREKIGQVLENLLSNAIKYSPPGTRIRLAGTLLDNSYRISVIDQGIGMTPDQVERIFDKFYRADASDQAIGGIGLGMSIARSIVEAHEGAIWVESSPGMGTAAHFILPLARSGEHPASP